MGAENQRLKMQLWATEREVEKLESQIEKQQAKISELEKIAFTSYCQGYERGHNDTVEGSYSPPAEYPEEWPEIRKEIELMVED